MFSRKREKSCGRWRTRTKDRHMFAKNYEPSSRRSFFDPWILGSLDRNICSLLVPKQTCLCSFARNSFFLSFLRCRHCGISNCLDSIWNVGQENDRGRNYFVKKFFLRILLAFYDSRRFKRVCTLWNIYYRCFQLWNYPRTRNYGNHYGNYGLNYPIKISGRNRLNKQNWITNYLFNIQIQMVQKQSLEILICNSNINYFYRANFQRNERHA